MPPFDRAHTTCYSTLIEPMRLSCTVFEIKPAICRKSPILTHPTPPAFGALIDEFFGDLWHPTRVQNLKSLALAVAGILHGV